MNRSTKGAVAAAAAAVLLLGGAGSLAYWSDSDTVAGEDFTAGTLTLTALPGDPAGDCAEWNLDTTESDGQPFDPQSELIVPGDTITKICAFTIDASGTHLRATVDAVPGTDDLTDLGLTVSADTVKVGVDFATAATVTEITEDDDAKIAYVEVAVTFPYGTAGTNGLGGVSTNETQGLSSSLDDIDVVTTQVHNP